MENKNESKKLENISYYDYDRFNNPDIIDLFKPQYIDYQLDRKFRITEIFTDNWIQLGVKSNFYIHFMSGFFKGVILPQPSLLGFGLMENFRKLTKVEGLIKMSSDIMRRSIIFGHWYGFYMGTNETLFIRTDLDQYVRYTISAITSSSICYAIFSKPQYLFTPAHFLLFGTAAFGILP